MKKLRGILFLLKCFGYIAFRILDGREWNSMNVNLEDKDGSRRIIDYRRTSTGYRLDSWAPFKAGD
jgi:hypothetical protein